MNDSLQVVQTLLKSVRVVHTERHMERGERVREDQENTVTFKTVPCLHMLLYSKDNVERINSRNGMQ